MTEKQPSNRHPTRRQVGQGSLRPPTGRPTNHPIGDYCTLVLGLGAGLRSLCPYGTTSQPPPNPSRTLFHIRERVRLILVRSRLDFVEWSAGERVWLRLPVTVSAVS